MTRINNTYSHFPNEVWDGITPSRTHDGIHVAPGPFDFDRMIAEIIAVEDYLLTLGPSVNFATANLQFENNRVHDLNSHTVEILVSAGSFFNLTGTSTQLVFGEDSILFANAASSLEIADDSIMVNAPIIELNGKVQCSQPVALGIVADDDADNGTMYFGSDHGNKLCVKDLSGAVTELTV
jgi:hypothetical protein